MKVNIKHLMDDAQCYDTVRELRWPDGRRCPFCDSKRIIRRGFDDKEPARQRYECKDCKKRFDDLTGTIFAEALTTQPPSELDVLAVCGSAVAHCIAVSFDDFQNIGVNIVCNARVAFGVGVESIGLVKIGFSGHIF